MHENLPICEVDQNNFIKKLRKYTCGGVKYGPVTQAQEQRFINNTPEEKKSQRTVVIKRRACKHPGRLVREEYPPRT